MKIRSGFVSNSSSSSYLIYGFLEESLPEDIGDQYDAIKWDKFGNNVYGQECDVCGIPLLEWEDCDVVEPEALTEYINSFSKYKEEIKKKFKEALDYDLPDDLFAVIALTTYS